MRNFRSGFANDIKCFIAYQEASGSWNDVGYGANIRIFDHYCADVFSADAPICQEMVDSWCSKRDSESNYSCNDRNHVIRLFIKYLQCRNLASISAPPILKSEKSTYVPHAFDGEELCRFFAVCDSLPHGNGVATEIKRLICPAIFRLLYSSGIRTTEARYLRVKDVDLHSGVLSISKSKGYDQHFVALHPTMTHLLKRYNTAICSVQPDRTYFFETIGGSYYSHGWLTATFNELWIRANGSANKPVPYELRHNYAVQNINGWNSNDSFAFSDKLNYLSKSMGHRHIKSTLWYFSIVPRLTETLVQKTESGFNDIVPEVCYEKD